MIMTKPQRHTTYARLHHINVFFFSQSLFTFTHSFRVLQEMLLNIGDRIVSYWIGSFVTANVDGCVDSFPSFSFVFKFHGLHLPKNAIHMHEQATDWNSKISNKTHQKIVNCERENCILHVGNCLSENQRKIMRWNVNNFTLSHKRTQCNSNHHFIFPLPICPLPSFKFFILIFSNSNHSKDCTDPIVGEAVSEQNNYLKPFSVCNE